MTVFSKATFYFCFAVSIIYLAVGTYDVNIKEFQLVADHLSQKECRKLMEALNETHFYPTHKITGKAAPHGKPCIDMLLSWNEKAGTDKMSVGK